MLINSTRKHASKEDLKLEMVYHVFTVIISLAMAIAFGYAVAEHVLYWGEPRTIIILILLILVTLSSVITTSHCVYEYWNLCDSEEK